MRFVVGATLLATFTGCGGAKHDPYKASLQEGSEHVELRGVVNGQQLRASGDFANETGKMTIHSGGKVVHEVVAGHRVYVDLGDGWVTGTTAGFVTPAQVFQRRVPADIEHGLVHSVVLKTKFGHETISFSKYGEHVSVTVPRVKGAAK
jgi:hypothetical protein